MKYNRILVAILAVSLSSQVVATENNDEVTVEVKQANTGVKVAAAAAVTGLACATGTYFVAKHYANKNLVSVTDKQIATEDDFAFIPEYLAKNENVKAKYAKKAKSLKSVIKYEEVKDKDGKVTKTIPTKASLALVNLNPVKGVALPEGEFKAEDLDKVIDAAIEAFNVEADAACEAKLDAKAVKIEAHLNAKIAAYNTDKKEARVKAAKEAAEKKAADKKEAAEKKAADKN